MSFDIIPDRDYVRNYDPEMASYVHVSHFGALKTSPVIPVIEGNFPGSSLDKNIWSSQTKNSASVSVGSGVADINCGTNSAGSAVVASLRVGRFVAGQVTVFQSGVYADTGIASNVRRWGLMDAGRNNGLFFEWNGTTFRVVARAGGSDTAVASASFNGDTTFSPSASNNTYRIFYSAGRAVFCAAQSGNLRKLHTMTDADYPLIEDLDLGIYYENTNSGNTTDKTLRVRGASISVFGEQKRFDSGGGLYVVPIEDEVALGNVPSQGVGDKFGRNSAVSAAEDIWEGGGTYTGFNATANENLAVVSASTADAGSVVSSGTATDGSTTSLTDSGATFVTDGVAVGDVVVNDTIGIHGVITARTETVLTVAEMVDGGGVPRNNAGDSYRVVTTSSTGAALVKVSNILDADYEIQTSKYVVMNGTTTVTTTVNCMRSSRARVVLAGSGGGNAGVITAKQASTTANVFWSILAGYNRTQVCADTVPAGKVYLIKSIDPSIIRANGAAASATATFRVRPRGQVFEALRPYELQNGSGSPKAENIVLRPGTDFKLRIEAVSNTVVAQCTMKFKIYNAVKL